MRMFLLAELVQRRCWSWPEITLKGRAAMPQQTKNSLFGNHVSISYLTMLTLFGAKTAIETAPASAIQAAIVSEFPTPKV